MSASADKPSRGERADDTRKDHSNRYHYSEVLGLYRKRPDGESQKRWKCTGRFRYRDLKEAVGAAEASSEGVRVVIMIAV